MLVKNLTHCLVNEKDTIKKCILSLEKSTQQIIFVINKQKKLLGSITDGDIRRAILNKFDINENIRLIYNKKPIKCLMGTSYEEAEKIMIANRINHLPLVNRKNSIIGFFKLSLKNFFGNENKCDFIIMAGGKGKRLRPLTLKTPKPMLKINNEPILKLIIDRAKKFGFSDFYISINYLGKIIQEYFKDGKKFNTNIKYIFEKKPLGTIGSIANIKDKLPNKNLIVSNGDVITEINYNSMLKFHENNGADATMAVYPYEIKNPYGEVVTKEENILEIKEKPITISYVNAGVYIFKKKVLKYMVKNKKLDAVEFFNFLKKKNKKTLAFAIHETWRDIGLKKDYLKFKKK